MSSTRFGPYRLMQRLGAGSSGVVYRAHRRGSADPVAIKRIRPELGREPRFVAALAEEARISARLVHPGIVRLHQTGQVRGECFLEMECVDGVSLKQLLSRLAADGRLLPVDLGLHIAAAIAAALGYAHRQQDEEGRPLNIVHRDVNPSNVMISHEGQVKLLDFGIATAARHIRPEQTGSGLIKGTLGYLSPEQAEERALDGRSDLFSLGVVLHECLTGERLFAARSPLHSLQLLQHGAVGPASQQRAEIAPAVDALVATLLARDPSARPATGEMAAAALRAQANLTETAGAAALRALLAELPPAPALSEMDPLPGTRRLARPGRGAWQKPARWAAGGLVAAALAVALFQGLRSRSAPPATTSAPALERQVPEAARTIALLGLGQRNRERNGDRNASWLTTAFAEILTVELGRGERLLVLPIEEVERARLQVSPDRARALTSAELTKVGALLGADYLVRGSSNVGPASGQVTLALEVVASGSGQVVASAGGTDKETALYDLAAATAARLRSALGQAGSEARAGDSGRSALPSNAEATRLYAEGLAKLEAKEPAAARTLLEKAVRADPKHGPAHLALATAWSNLGYESRAEAAASRALRFVNALSLEQRLLLKARAHAIAQRWSAASEAFETLCEAFPHKLEYGLALADARMRTGAIDAALATLARLRRLPPPSGDDARIDLAVARTTARDPARSLAAAAKAKAKARARGATLLMAEIELAEALAHSFDGNCPEAQRLAEASKRQFSAVGQWSEVLFADNLVANCLADGNDDESALLIFQAALQTVRRLGNRRREHMLMGNTAATLLSLGRRAEARRMFHEALALARELNDPSSVASYMANLGVERLEEHEPARAVSFFSEAVTICRTECREDLPRYVAVLARAYLRVGSFAQARAASNEAIALGRLAGDPPGLVDALAVAAEAQRLLGLPAEAARSNDERRTLAARINGLRDLASSDIVAAWLAFDENQLERAATLAETALTHKGPGGIHPVSTYAARSVLARVALARGELAQAQRHYEDARAAAAQGGSEGTNAALDLIRARVLNAQGAEKRARQLVSAAITFARRRRLIPLELEARLVAEELGPRSAGRLLRLAAAARRQGYVLLERQALALTKQRHPARAGATAQAGI